MKRYVRQKDGWSCGPVALLNAIKWAGFPGSLKKDLPRLQRMCKQKAGSGTYWWDFFTSLLKLKRKFRLTHYGHARADEVYNYVKSGGAVLISYETKFYKRTNIAWRHFILVVGEGKDVYVVNRAWKRTVEKFSKPKLRKLLTNYKKEGPQAWYIAKY